MEIASGGFTIRAGHAKSEESASTKLEVLGTIGVRYGGAGVSGRSRNSESPPPSSLNPSPELEAGFQPTPGGIDNQPILWIPSTPPAENASLRDVPSPLPNLWPGQPRPGAGYTSFKGAATNKILFTKQIRSREPGDDKMSARRH